MFIRDTNNLPASIEIFPKYCLFHFCIPPVIIYTFMDENPNVMFHSPVDVVLVQIYKKKK